jgi:hypothetical protein
MGGGGAGAGRLPAFRARQVELGRLGGIALEAGHAVGVLGHARCAHRPALQRYGASSLQHRELLYCSEFPACTRKNYCQALAKLKLSFSTA